MHTVVQGGPVGPQGIEPLALLVRDHADPAGQHPVIQKKLLGPAGPKVKEPLAVLVLNHADPAGQRAAIQNTTSLWERLPAQPEPPCGDGLVERISYEEPTVRQVSGSALDSQLMQGITYSEVSLDSRPMEGSSGLKPVEQSILRSPRIMRPRDGSGLVENISDEEPTACQVPGSALDSQLMEGITYSEVSPDSRPMEGVSCLEPVKQSILRSSQTERSQIGDRLVKGISDKEPTICQVPGSALDSQLMEGISQPELLALGASSDCRPMEGASCLEPVDQLIFLSSWTVSPCNCVITGSHSDFCSITQLHGDCEPVITPAISYYLDSRPMEGMTYLEHPAMGVSLDSWPMEGLVIKQKSEWEPVITPAINHNLDSRPM